MLIPARLHDPIRRGDVTLAFRRWKRPTVTAGGTLRTAAGVLAIDEVAAISSDDISDGAARQAGFRSRDDLLGSLHPGDGRTLFRIRFHLIGDDPRTALREETELDDDDVTAIDAQLDRWDAASRSGPWTAALLDLIAARPAEAARSLAAAADTDREQLKRRVRQLKGLGLTESLGTGYRISPRGKSYLDRKQRVDVG